MSDLNIYRCTPREAKKHFKRCIIANVTPFIQSSPGMGKSSIVKEIAEELRLKVIDHRLSTSAPEDMSGLPHFDENGNACFAPFADLFPLEDTPIPEGYDGWLIFLDEFNSAPRGVQAAAYKLVLDHMTGQKKLHPNVRIGAAGNLSTDRAITNDIGSAMQSRMVHIEMRESFEEWYEDVALKHNYDQRIIAYLSNKNSALMDFRPDHNEKTFCCPRTWEFMNKLIQGEPVVDEDTSLFAGCITSGEAVGFVQFTKVYADLIKIETILSDPHNAPVPKDNSTRWAAICMMMEQVNDDTFDAIATYANRFDMTFRILFYRSVLVRNQDLRQHPSFAKAMIDLSRYLNG